MTREKLEKFEYEFWTVLDELVEDLEEDGIEVVWKCDEYISVVDEDEEDAEIQIILGHAGTTIWFESIRDRR